ncbi:MAG: EamA family transporter [Hydrogenophaga sp.]|nr:EamA family transporter [Hydrogenophaga sp.]
MSAAPRFAWPDYLAAGAVVLIWGLNFVAMKFALQALSPFQLGAARYVVAALPLVFLIRRPSVQARWVLLYGLCQGVGQFGLLFVALKVGMSAALASVLMQTQVFYTVIFSAVFLHEKPGRNLQLGLWLAAVALLCFGTDVIVTAGQGVTALGLMLNLGAAGMWAVSNIVARKAQQSVAYPAGYDPLAFVVWSSLVPILPFVALSAWMDPPFIWASLSQVDWRSWTSVLYLGWFATILSYALWTGLLKRHPANRVVPLSLGVPVVGLLAGLLALQESVTAWQWAGTGLTISALAFVFRRERVVATPRINPLVKEAP